MAAARREMSGGVRLSATEREFLLRGVDQGLRADGRGRHDFRSFEVDTGLAPQTNGSARLRCPHSQTDIVVGVKLEIAEPKLEQPGEGYLSFSVDWCAPLPPRTALTAVARAGRAEHPARVSSCAHVQLRRRVSRVSREECGRHQQRARAYP